jgi:hypothetical protein
MRTIHYCADRSESRPCVIHVAREGELCSYHAIVRQPTGCAGRRRDGQPCPVEIYEPGARLCWLHQAAVDQSRRDNQGKARRKRAAIRRSRRTRRTTR